MGDFSIIHRARWIQAGNSNFDIPIAWDLYVGGWMFFELRHDSRMLGTTSKHGLIANGLIWNKADNVEKFRDGGGLRQNRIAHGIVFYTKSMRYDSASQKLHGSQASTEGISKWGIRTFPRESVAETPRAHGEFPYINRFSEDTRRPSGPP